MINNRDFDIELEGIKLAFKRINEDVTKRIEESTADTVTAYEALSQRLKVVEERAERHARLCELRHRDDAEDIAKLQATLDRAAGEHP